MTTWATNGIFKLDDGTFGNPGCDECGSEDAIVKVGSEYLCADGARKRGIADDDTLRRTYGPDDDGTTVEAKLTDEGVIIDIFDGNGECIGTFGNTWVELIEWLAPDRGLDA